MARDKYKPYRRVEDEPIQDPLPPNTTTRAYISHYDPRLGGTNCFNFVDGWCVSPMASGKRWEDYFGVALACPAEYPFGTVFVIGDKEWICLDRGGAILTNPDGTIWLDMLLDVPEYNYGSLVEVQIKE